MNALVKAEAAREAYTTVAQDCEAIEASNKERYFQMVVCGGDLPCHIGGSLSIFDYKQAGDNFLEEATSEELDQLTTAIQQARVAKIEANLLSKTSAKELLEAITNITNLIDERVKKHIKDNYETTRECDEARFGPAA